MQTVFGARLEHYASTARASPALAMPGREIAYSELLRRVRSCAAWLTGEPGLPLQPVGITIAEEIPHLVASLTLLSLGVTQVSLPTSEPVSKRLNLAERLGVGRVLLTDPQYALPGRDAQLLTPDLDEPAAGHASLDAVLSDPDAPAIYFTSSGTSGEPKAFALSQRALAWRAELITASERIGAGDRSLTLLSVEDFLAKSRLLRCAYLGLTSVLAESRSSPFVSLQELCASLGVTCRKACTWRNARNQHNRAFPRTLDRHIDRQRLVNFTCGIMPKDELRNLWRRSPGNNRGPLRVRREPGRYRAPQ